MVKQAFMADIQDYFIFSKKNRKKNSDTEGWSIVADLEPAIVAPGSVIPHFPARKRKFNIEDSFYDDILENFAIYFF
jgi:hypothetical protein